MTATLSLSLALMLLVIPTAGEAAVQPDSREVAALVSGLSGSASVNPPRGTNLKLFDWVRAGAIVQVPRGSTLTLVLTSGSRFELAGPARATVTGSGLSKTSGAVRELSAVPRLPHVAPIADRKQVGRHSAAVRVRGQRITNLYPADGAVTRVAATVFAFGAVEPGVRYALEVEDASGKRVFQIETEETRVVMPTALNAGSTYYWRVSTVGAAGAQARGEAEFSTLAARDEQAREALRDSLGTSGDAHGLALLAHIDYSLGLFAEARDGVRIALEKSPDDPLLRAALRELGQKLGLINL